MSRRRLLAWVAVYSSGGLALLGFLVFVIGIFYEFIVTRSRPFTDDLSPTMQLALAGLCLSALMVSFGFLLIGLLLARQTRVQAPGYGEAYDLIQRLQFSQAIPLLEQAVRRGRETPDVLMLLTSAYAHTGQLAKAQATADRAVQLFPQDASAYITLANGYRLQASYEEAARALQKAIELSPEQPSVWAELGFLYKMAGDERQAIEAFRRATDGMMSEMYAVRVFYYLCEHAKRAGNLEQANEFSQKMCQARDGLEAWRPIQKSLEGTTYGHFLRYEIANIEQALAQASCET
jgi:tetratricopeptide (TPR) repeat protein